MSNTNTWYGSPTKLDDGTWGVKVSADQVESVVESGNDDTFYRFEREPRVGDKVRVTTRTGKTWMTTIASGGEFVRDPYGGHWKCETPATKKAQTKMSPQERERKINAAADRRYNIRKRRRQMMAEWGYGG